MIKKIKINEKEFTIHSSALTSFKYKEMTGRELLTDIQSMQKMDKVDKNNALQITDDLLDKLLKITYVMIEEQDPTQVDGYESFLKSLDTLFDDDQWMSDVIETAIHPISGGNKTIPPQK